MYKRHTQGWWRHYDFLLLDEISLQVSFIIAVYLRHHNWAYSSALYTQVGIILILLDIVVFVLNDSMNNVLKRGYLVEAVETVKHCFFVFALVLIFVFAAKTGSQYSRLIFSLILVFHIVIGYITRILWKIWIRKRHREKKDSNMLVVASPETVEKIMERLTSAPASDYRITGIILTDHETGYKTSYKTGSSQKKMIGSIPIVSDIDHAADYILSNWVDSVYIDAPLKDEKILRLLDDCAVMAIPTHYHVPDMSRGGVKRFSEKIGGTIVLTSSVNYMTPAEAFVKRFGDIIGGIVGSLLALLLMLIIGPMIKKASPGPILFKQERIGRNGKRFRIYKIRSMYMDAEERRQELMKQNRVKDGMMFKLDFDPRIIGNKILPDGTVKTGIGAFIRNHSLDGSVIIRQTRKEPLLARFSLVLSMLNFLPYLRFRVFRCPT